MTRLRVTQEHRGGRGRLYISLPDGTGIAWYDKDNGRVSLLQAARREEVLAALAPYLTGEVTVGPPPVPTAADLARLSLHPDDDLAPNRPGEELYAGLHAPPPGSVRRLRHDPRRAELLARQAVGERLDRLEGSGWRVLHSLPLPGTGSHIDHLAIGPAGVLAVHVLLAHQRRVRVADPMAGAGRAAPLPYLRWVRHAADRACLVLTTGVRPVLVVAGASRLEVVAAPPDVRILHDTEIHTLAGLPAVLGPAGIESLYSAARDRRTWQSA